MKKQKYTNLPREELLKRAEEALKNYPQGEGIKAEVHFKFTCEKCGERCMFEKPNELFEKGECYKCGHSTPIKEGGFAVIVNYPPLKFEM